jgi:hypothetical protein
MMVAGAYARILAANSKQIGWAAWLNWALCRAWLANFEPEQVSFPASELFRLRQITRVILELSFVGELEDDVLARLGGRASAREKSWYAQHWITAEGVYAEQVDAQCESDWTCISSMAESGPVMRTLRLGAAAIAQARKEKSPSKIFYSEPANQPLRAAKLKREETSLSCAGLLELEDQLYLDRMGDAVDEKLVVEALEAIEKTDFATVHFAKKYHDGNLIEQARYVVKYSPY